MLFFLTKWVCINAAVLNSHTVVLELLIDRFVHSVNTDCSCCGHLAIVAQYSIVQLQYLCYAAAWIMLSRVGLACLFHKVIQFYICKGYFGSLCSYYHPVRSIDSILTCHHNLKSLLNPDNFLICWVKMFCLVKMHHTKIGVKNVCSKRMHDPQAQSTPLGGAVLQN